MSDLFFFVLLLRCKGFHRGHSEVYVVEGQPWAVSIVTILLTHTACADIRIGSLVGVRFALLPWPCWHSERLGSGRLHHGMLATTTFPCLSTSGFVWAQPLGAFRLPGWSVARCLSCELHPPGA